MRKVCESTHLIILELVPEICSLTTSDAKCSDEHNIRIFDFEAYIYLFINTSVFHLARELNLSEDTLGHFKNRIFPMK